MEYLFGKRKTFKELLAENKRLINKSIRQLDRERTNLQRSEKAKIREIKKVASEGQMEAVKIMARDLVQTRRNITNCYKMKSQLEGTLQQISTVQTQQTMQQAMLNVTKAMFMINAQMNLPQMQRMMMEFEKQSEFLEMKQELMEDVMTDALEQDKIDNETDDLVGQILDEIGININSQLATVPTNAAATQVKQPQMIAEGDNPVNRPPASPTPKQHTDISDTDIDDLQARLNNLRK